ncbi:MAG: hypothetical protein CR986_05970 [Ignavibacteriae bacterium]|nr:MAG: hypothetical protein CR986_05970 [Ignavibacteriota bacterium]
MNKSKILIVEDEVIIAMEIADRLQSMGYDVLRIVANGKDAIACAINEKPDLILMDIMIQGPIDGIETATKIQERINIPVIYLTANADEATLERAKVSDAFGYLIKPFEEKELNTTIEMSLYKHRMELKLRESEQRYRSLVSNSSIGIFRLNKEGKIVHGNPAFIKLVGSNKFNEIAGKPIYRFFVGGKEKFDHLCQICNKTNEVKRYRVEIQNGKQNFVVSLSGNTFKNNKGEIVYFDGTMEDVTMQQRYEEKLVKAKEKAEESDRLKTEFLAGMSHEIRTPVNTIMNYLSLLRDSLTDIEKSTYDDVFSAIQVGSLRLTRTIDSIINMAQFRAGTFEIFKKEMDLYEDVLKTINKEFEYTAKQRGLELKLTNYATNTKIFGDKYSLSQLFTNLVDNGLKYTEKGSVEIKIYNLDNGGLVVDIKDTGIGISEEFLPILFKPFSQEEQGYTRSFDGNGLGLALVQKYCGLNDAKIKVRSKKDVGTIFTIQFLQNELNSKIKVKQK